MSVRTSVSHARPATRSTNGTNTPACTGSPIGAAGRIAMRISCPWWRKVHRPPQEGISALGRAEAPRAPPPALAGRRVSRDQHRARRVGPPRIGAAATAPSTTAADLHAADPAARAQRAMVRGLQSGVPARPSPLLLPLTITIPHHSGIAFVGATPGADSAGPDLQPIITATDGPIRRQASPPTGA
jgi:hypothetical protein